MSVLERFARRNRSLRAHRDRPYFKPRPVYITDDGRSHSLFSRQRDIMNQILSPTIRHFNLDGSSSLSFSRRSPSPRADQSSESLTSEESVEPNWNQPKLLDLSDSIREGLRGGNIFGPDAEKLSCFLEAALKDEERKYPTLDFDMIEYARLDKLLAELLQFGETMKTSGLTPELLLRFRVDVSEARNLRRSWRRRFREQFFMMDQHRCAILIQGGLKDVSFNSSLDYDLGKWQTKKVTNLVSEIEGNLEFEPGHWWLNITCAERDGIVNSSLETPTKGCYGFTALPLLTGSEELIRPNTVKYVREGRTSDMHIALISQVGRKIRILRGHKLKSILAPEAGLRYDGLYTIRQYGFKLNNNTNKYRLELTLERATDQRPFESICNVPKPSQLDDWALYEKLEGDKVKLLQGEASYLEWKLKRQEEKVDREEWQRARLFRASFSLSGAAGPGERLDRRVTFRP